MEIVFEVWLRWGSTDSYKAREAEISCGVQDVINYAACRAEKKVTHFLFPIISNEIYGSQGIQK
jgi:hypothetical protein